MVAVFSPRTALPCGSAPASVTAGAADDGDAAAGAALPKDGRAELLHALAVRPPGHPVRPRHSETPCSVQPFVPTGLGILAGQCGGGGGGRLLGSRGRLFGEGRSSPALRSGCRAGCWQPGGQLQSAAGLGCCTLSVVRVGCRALPLVRAGSRSAERGGAMRVLWAGSASARGSSALRMRWRLCRARARTRRSISSPRSTTSAPSARVRAPCCLLLRACRSASLCCSVWRSTALTTSPFGTLASTFRAQACRRWFLDSPRPHRRLYPSWRCVSTRDASAPAVLSGRGCADGLCRVLLHQRRQVLAREAVRDIASRPFSRLWELDC